MRPRQFRTGPVMAVLLFLLVLWPAMQLYGMLKSSHTSSDPLSMLYEVAQFQISLWQGTMQEAKRYESTAPLNKVKLVAYSAGYTHERLVRAVGEDRLAPLPGLSRFVEFITVLQISGDRQLTDLEREVLEQAAAIAPQLSDSYAGLFSSSGKIIGSKNEAVQAADQRLSETLERYFHPE
ncbi:S-adenosylmethionine decarboxylase [Paenibacillus dendritiformis]|uniref:S-adenosylmethionine decarboxylase n=1 Tax=Paenibacillus dendritiformis TaxID=130049 RepID=UPI0018CF72D0|nr:S-adenosylmethionine decarboxylase [Paenibacillus dendritiformis]MBG9793044.1 S-adenosylmethionine decarboxylase [Paenibacillus dendritiformis]